MVGKIIMAVDLYIYSLPLHLSINSPPIHLSIYLSPYLSINPHLPTHQPHSSPQSTHPTFLPHHPGAVVLCGLTGSPASRYPGWKRFGRPRRYRGRCGESAN